MEAELDFKGKKVLVEVKDELGWKESNDCVRKATKYVNNKPELDLVTQFELMVEKSILTVKDKETGAVIQNNVFLSEINKKTGDELFKIINDLNSPDKEQKKKLEQPSSVKD